MAVNTYQSFSRPKGVTEWDREEYVKEDGMKDTRYKIHTGEIFCRVSLSHSGILCSNTNGYCSTNALTSHVNKIHPAEGQKLPKRNKGNRSDNVKTAASVHFAHQMKLVEDFNLNRSLSEASTAGQSRNQAPALPHGPVWMLEQSGDDDKLFYVYKLSSKEG